MVNTKELENEINKSGLKRCYLAEKMGLSRQGFRLKCINKNPFTVDEVAKLCELLNITKLTQKERIFFAKQVE